MQRKLWITAGFAASHSLQPLVVQRVAINAHPITLVRIPNSRSPATISDGTRQP